MLFLPRIFSIHRSPSLGNPEVKFLAKTARLVWAHHRSFWQDFFFHFEPWALGKVVSFLEGHQLDNRHVEVGSGSFCVWFFLIVFDHSIIFFGGIDGWPSVCIIGTWFSWLAIRIFCAIVLGDHFLNFSWELVDLGSFVLKWMLVSIFVSWCGEGFHPVRKAWIPLSMLGGLAILTCGSNCFGMEIKNECTFTLSFRTGSPYGIPSVCIIRKLLILTTKSTCGVLILKIAWSCSHLNCWCMSHAHLIHNNCWLWTCP